MTFEAAGLFGVARREARGVRGVHIVRDRGVSEAGAGG